jgi:hypothetical protein
MRGIQVTQSLNYNLTIQSKGENNSCAIDSAITALFGMNGMFDNHLRTITFTSKESSMIAEYLRYYIINELRTRVFVEKQHMVTWRRMIGSYLRQLEVNFNDCCQEVDVGEVHILFYFILI